MAAAVAADATGFEMNVAKFFALGLAAGGLMATSAFAATVPGVYNTGVDSAHMVQPNGTVDSHYTVDGNPAITYNNAAYAQAGDATYIAVQADGGYTNVNNVYSTTFDLTGFNPQTAVLTGSASVDDSAEVFLNNHSLGDIEEFHSLQPFSAPAVDFISGINTLSFDVHDVGIPPSALEVSALSVTADAVSAAPEPSTWVLMLGGIGLLGGLLRTARARRRESCATA